MRTTPLAELVPEPSSVFIDNVALCSADRILNGSYESVRDNELLRRDLPGNATTAATLVAHDLVNLSILLESMVCFDQIITNADYVDRWNTDIESTSLRYLDDIVVAASLSKAERWDAESSVVLSPEWMRSAEVDGADDLAFLVAHAIHDNWSTQSHGGGWSDDKRDLLLPYTESSRPFPSGSGIVVGAGFYVIASRTLGVPYRPSALRARLLTSILRAELASWRFQAGAVALDFLESNMAEAAKQYWGRLAEMGLVDVVRPLILSAVLSMAQSPDEILAYARQIRDLPEAAAFRQWSAQLTQLLVEGTSATVAKTFKKDLEAAAEPLNRRLGFGNAEGRVSIGYGPVSASKSFGLPPIGAYARRAAKRHVWLLQSLNDTVGELTRVSSRVESVIYPRLPGWLMDQLRDSPIQWNNIQFRP